VSQLAYRWGRYKYAVEQLANPQDMIQTFESGATNVSAWYTVMEREANFVMKLATQLGISQKSREGILAFKTDANEPGGLMSKLQAIREQSNRKV
jgi:phage terminase small subunit